MVHDISWEADGVTLTPRIKEGSFSYKEQVNTEHNLRFGAVASKAIYFRGFYDSSNPAPVGASLDYYDRDGNFVGRFYAETTVETKNEYSVVAYDEIVKLKADFSAHLSEIQFPVTLAQLVQAACSVASVPIDTQNMALGSMSVESFYADNISCAQILSWAAEIEGKFVRVKRESSSSVTPSLEFAWYAQNALYDIAPSDGQSGGVAHVYYKQDGLQYEDYVTATVDAVSIKPAETDGAAYTYPNVSGGNIYPVSDNLLLTNATQATMVSVAQNMYSAIQEFAYRPATVRLFPFNCPFKAGDRVQVTDANGDSFSTVIMAVTETDSETIVYSTGDETYETQAPSSIPKQLANLAQNVVRIKDLIVENVEALYARIADLFAENITVTGSLHSEDFVGGDTYADQGMGLDFGAKTFQAENFAVDASGGIHAKAGHIAGMEIIDNTTLNPDAPEARGVDSGGQPIPTYRQPDATTRIDQAGRLVYTPITLAPPSGVLAQHLDVTITSRAANQPYTISLEYMDGRDQTQTVIFSEDIEGVISTSDTSVYVAPTINRDYLAAYLVVRVTVESTSGFFCKLTAEYESGKAALARGATALDEAIPGTFYLGTDGLSLSDTVMIRGSDGFARVVSMSLGDIQDLEADFNGVSDKVDQINTVLGGAASAADVRAALGITTVNAENLTANWLNMSAARNNAGMKFIRSAAGPNANMAAGTERAVGTLSANYRPSYNINHFCVVNDSGTLCLLKITTAGVVTITPYSAIPTTQAININLAYI